MLTVSPVRQWESRELSGAFTCMWREGDLCQAYSIQQLASTCPATP